MIYDNWLYLGTLGLKIAECPPLKEEVKTECLVIGGGVAGLHAALRLVDSGKKVVLLEKSICGGSSSGRSGGFLTPESEEDVRVLIQKVGKDKAKIISEIPVRGIDLIVKTIQKNNLKCDLRKQDSMYVSVVSSKDKLIREEAETRKEMGLPFKIYEGAELKKIHPGKNYRVGLRYPGSYGINSLAYCQELKNLLVEKGVKVYENTEVHQMSDNTAKAHMGSVKANNIIVCIDKMKEEFDKDISKKYYHIQTYLSVSEPIKDKEVKLIFPKGEMMCWDTDMFYMHYRMIEGNRIMLGRSSFFTSYMTRHYNSPGVINSAIKEFRKRFPSLGHVRFTHFWGGLIDVTKDLTPIADYDPRNKSIQYALGCAGLPWAAFCGDYLARRLVNKNTEDLSEYFGINKKFAFSDFIQRFLGKPLSFALSHLYSLFQ